VLNGGHVVSTVVSAGGFEYVSSGGTANFTVVSAGGVEAVSGGTTVSAVVSNSGEELVYSGTASGTVVLSGGFEYAFSSGTVVSTVVSSGGTEFLQHGGTAVSTVVSGGGIEYVLSGSTASGTVVSSGGTQNILTGGTAVSAVVSAGGVEAVSGGTTVGTVVSSSGIEYVSSGGTASGTVLSSGGTEIVFSGGTASNTQVLSGGTLDERAIAYSTSATTSFNSSTSTLTISQGGQTYDVSLQGNYAGDTFVLAADGYGGTEITITCFYPGTRLASAEGEIMVEAIRPGTLLRTASDALKPVRWLGRSTVSTRFADPLRVLPIRITAGALGDQLPARDLLVSPDHALFIGGILVQAGALVNGVSIRREVDVPEIFTYYHVELATHELLLAEGVPTESFVDNVDRMHFDNWAEHEALGDTAPIAEMPYPRAKSARQVPPSLRRILDARTRLAAAS
jgi:autotransporter passenger strand-loop-strand repeat protein